MMKSITLIYLKLQKLLHQLIMQIYLYLNLIPDSWAINQIFPIVPIHRHLEEPFCKGNFADLTCDSDGKLNNFIDNGKIKSLLKFA